MKEIKVTIKLTVYADDRDKELLDEAVYDHLLELMEERDLPYKYKATEVEDDEDEELEEDFLE